MPFIPSIMGNLFSNIVVGKGASTSARFSFILQDCDWAVGIIPESRQSQQDVIESSPIGWNHSAGQQQYANVCMTTEFDAAMAQSSVCTVSVDSALLELTLEIDGADVDTQQLLPSMFPLRLGMCGFSGITVNVVNGGVSTRPVQASQPLDSFRIGDFVRVKPPQVAQAPITDFSSSALAKMIQETHSQGLISHFTSSECQRSSIQNLKQASVQFLCLFLIY